MSTILIDVDYVTLDLHFVWYALYNRDYNDNLKLNDVTRWALHEFVKPECGKKIYDYLLLPDLYDTVPVVDGAIEGVKRLKENGHRVVFASSGIHRGKYLRLKHFGLLDSESDFYCAHDKSIIDGKYLLDDALHNVQAYTRGTGILYDAPHNQYEDWYPRVNNWEEAVNTILNMEEQRHFARRMYVTE